MVLREYTIISRYPPKATLFYIQGVQMNPLTSQKKKIIYVGSRFLDRVHYNEFVENWSKSWALMRWRLVLGVNNTQNRIAQCPKEKGRLAQGRELPTLLASQEPLFFLWAFWPPPHALGDLYCYIPLFFIHLPHTLVNYPCPYSSARPIGHSFWCFMSCCGPHRIVQGSHPYQWGQGVSCEYLIRRWQLLLGLLFYHASMASP